MEKIVGAMDRESGQWHGTLPRPSDCREPGACVRQLDEGDRTELTEFLDGDPGFSLFPRSTLERFSLNATFVRYWGAFTRGRLTAVLMMIGGRAALYAPRHVTSTALAGVAAVAAREGISFTMGRTDLVDALVSHCTDYQVERREEHYLAALATVGPRQPRVPAPPGALVRRAEPSDIPALTQLYLGSDGFEGLDETQVRQTMSGRVRAARTYVAQAGGSLVSACSTSAETPQAAMIGGVWTTPAARNHGYGTAVVAALSRELAQHGRRPYLFYLMNNVTAARVYDRVGFQVVGRWTVAYLSPRGSA